ncbi:hypothetical protein FRC16_004468 [Serendipita sp. 398]|nr:hypothetical protein FRC16_004468 [Serendipita sp. 398]
MDGVNSGLKPIPMAFDAVSDTVLELIDGTLYHGISFGAVGKSVAGECVFQTGMVGYTEALTDPSYEGQILVLTYPLVGNYGVPERVKAELNKIPDDFESSRIHVAGLIVGYHSEEFSHFLAASSLGAWLKENGVPAIQGVDTRALTKRIREKGSLSGRLLAKRAGLSASPTAIQRVPLPSQGDDWKEEYNIVPFHDPNQDNLVAKVSTKEAQLFKPTGTARTHPTSNRPIRILAIDVGMKYNQIRCFTKRGVELKVVPWDYDFLAPSEEYDGLFISNGPGDPTMVKITITRLREALQRNTPIFGICLGHQLLALAAGARTSKMKYGNRGHNIPCTESFNDRCYITSQNHGYQVEVDSLPPNWQELFKNANDGSNEGIYCLDKPFFSVQFHPESTPGPRDTEFLFDVFLKNVEDTIKTGLPLPISLKNEHSVSGSTRVKVSKVLVLGSGGLSIGQAGEFDYSGSQALKALKEEGIYTILVNPNIATIATSKGLADKVYFLPVTPEFVRKIIKYEKPDGIYVTFGGQTALNVGIKLRDEFDALGVKVLGTPIATLIETEDRQRFADAMLQIGEKCAESATATTADDAVIAANKIGFPVIVRAAYALGGLGSGDSIVIAPSQTLSDTDFNMLRTTAINVIRHLGVVGECNIQYALNPDSKEYCIIEVNARLSRSSALASKATGYPLAFIAAKLGLGIPLNEIKNSVTKVTSACFEPSLDYVVVKIPRWDLKKFTKVSKVLSSSMKSVGEVMSIGRTFEETIQKAIRAIDDQFLGFGQNDICVENLEEELVKPTDKRIFAIANAFHKGYTVESIWEKTKIDRWFLTRLFYLYQVEVELSKTTLPSISPAVLQRAKRMGFSDKHLASIMGSTELALRRIRQENQISPFVKQIDTVAAEFPAATNYLYTTYNAIEHDVSFEDQGVIVLGSGVYRIGSSVEFDWCAVGAIRTLREQGLKTVMVNYNPETVSTDYDEADRLYFENISLETVLDIYDVEKAAGVIISMGGQSPNNIALPLHRENVKIFGTSPEMIDTAENRFKFSRLLDRIHVDQPQWKELSSFDDARAFCDVVGYPVLVRPSYVLSGAAMNVVSSADDLHNYLTQATAVSRDHPVVITKYIEEAKEIEVDAVAKDGKLVMHYISEHIENAGVHSGDATLVLPPQDLDPETVSRIEDATAKIGEALNVTGPYNIQFLAKNNQIKVIECNLRAARSFPFVSKVTGVDAIEMATKVMLGIHVDPYPVIDLPSDYVGVKVPQFSFSRLSGADPVLGVEMASTGEVACFGKDKYEAYIKALLSTGIVLPRQNILLSIGSFKEKLEMLPAAQKLVAAGFTLFGTSGTADFFNEHNVPCKYLETLQEGDVDQKTEYSLTQHLASNVIELYINLPSKNRYRRPATYSTKGYRTRRMAIDFDIPLITNVKCAKILAEALVRRMSLDVTEVDSKTSHTTHFFPGLVNICAFVPDIAIPGSTDITGVSKASVCGGFTTALLSPIGLHSSIIDDPSLTIAQKNAGGASHCNYSLSVAATGDNTKDITEEIAAEVVALYIPFNGLVTTLSIAGISSQIQRWPVDKPIVTDAKSPHLASVLLLASLHSRKIHVTSVSTKEDIQLIRLSKERKLGVTCDVSVYSLFFDQLSFSSTTCLPTKEDQDALWASLDIIDAFSVGLLPYQLAMELGQETSPRSGVEETLPLLLSAVEDKRLTFDDIKTRLYDNPVKIFNIPEQPQTKVEVVVNRLTPFRNKSKCWSPLQGKSVIGTVNRVLIQGRTVFLDGASFTSAIGRDLSSFETAMKRLGGEVVQVTANTSSVVKGETIADTVRTMACYTDAIVIRHPAVGSAQTAAKFSPVPILNAGDGIGEHPTQALLDVFTIRSELGTVNGRTITLLGDLKNGRTVHSLVTLLQFYSVRLNFVSPSLLAMPDSIVSSARRAGIPVTICESLDDVLEDTDVLYVTRVQKERFTNEEEWQSVASSYVVNHAVLARAKPDMIVMHPLPRVNEIDPDVDFDARRAVYFRQMRYGLFVRMALLASVLS